MRPIRLNLGFGRFVQIIFVSLLLLAIGLIKPQASQAAGTVNTCTEAAFLSALAGGGSVTFACSGVITLNSTLINGIIISSPTTVDAAGQNVTINANQRRAFDIFGVDTIFTLRNITVTNGLANQMGTGGGAVVRNGGGNRPGAVFIASNVAFVGNQTSGTGGAAIRLFAGSAIISNSRFLSNTSDNSAGTINIVNGTNLSVYRSVFDGNVMLNGGAIYNNGGNATVIESTFFNNYADDFVSGDGDGGGGAIFHKSGTTTITASTFFSNSAAYGGALSAENGDVFVVNSTMANNAALDATFGGGAIESYNNTSRIHLINSTIANNSSIGTDGGGGILTEIVSTLFLTNTIVASNTNAAGNGDNCLISANSTLVDGGNNLQFNPGSGCAGANANPRLGQLANNGGQTLTFALLAGSAAINAGNNTVCQASRVNNRDQRGVPRNQSGACDIGAFEVFTGTLPIASITPNSGNNQTTIVSTTFALPLQVVVQNSIGGQVTNTVVTFTAPASGASGVFSNTGTTTLTATTNANGIANAGIFRANGTTGTYTVTASVNGLSSIANFVLTNAAACNPLMVTSNTDNGLGNVCGSLSQALTQVQAGGTISFNLPIGNRVISVTSALPPVPSNVTLDAGCTISGTRGIPNVTLAASTNISTNIDIGLSISNSTTVNGFAMVGFTNVALRILGNGNVVTCNWIGTANGVTAGANSNGRINSNGIVIGSNTAAAQDNRLGLANQPQSGNLISGNNKIGITVVKGQGNLAYYNWIGLQSDGITSLRNGTGGVQVLIGGQLTFKVGNRVRQ